MHEYTNVNSNLREYILGVHHELSQNLESKIFRRFLTDNFDIKVTSDLYLNKLVLPLGKIWGYRSVRKIFNLKVRLNKRKRPKNLSMPNLLFCQRTLLED